LRQVLGATIMALVVVGCSAGSSDSGEAPAKDVALRVVVGDEVVRDWTLDELEAETDFADVTIEGDTQSGPLLVDVLAASGVNDWETGEVLGMSEGRVVDVTLDVESTSVDETWVFDVTNRGTLKLAAVDLPRNRWVRDVGEIRFP
jgi:hypothetical protein